MGITLAHVALPSRLRETRLTSVELLATTIPAFCRPINAMNRPIPAGMAFFTQSGIAVKIALRSPVTVSIIKTIPSISTSTNALAYVKPKPMQIV